MNKVDLINEISNVVNVSKKDAETVLNSLIDTIQETVSNGDKVTITGFGTFESRKRAARTGRNPQTGETIFIAAKTVPAFKAGKSFRNAVNS